jgi:Tfp pilus assembly protein PilF
MGLIFAGCSSESKTRKEPTPAAEKYLEDAREELEAKRLTEARALLELAREEGAPDASADQLAAKLERATGHNANEGGDIQKAYEHFKRAAKLEPDPDQRFDDLIVAIEYGQQIGAMAMHLAPMASEAVELKTRSAKAQRLAAQLWDDAGEPERALPYYAWLHKVAPDDTSVALRLAQLYVTSEQLRQAKQLFEKVHKAQPDNIIAALKLAELYADLNEHSKARSLYEQLIEAHPERASILIRYARYLHERGDIERAKSLQESAQEAQPGVERRDMRRLR